MVRNIGRHYYADRKFYSRVCKPDLSLATPTLTLPPQGGGNRKHVILNLFQDLIKKRSRNKCGMTKVISLAPQGRGIKGEGLLHRPDCKILKRVQDDRVLSEAHGKELNVLTSYRLNDFKKKAGATHVDMSDNIRRVAFTLAEVLITLGIIGVVAAMTIPTLVSSYKKKIVETRLVKVYSTFNQAIKMSEAENGPLTTWDTIDETSEWVDGVGAVIGESNISDWFDKYLAPYIKVLKVEKNTSNKDKKINVYMPDGSLVMISGNSWLVWPDANDFEATELGEDTDMTNRNIDDCGTKYFTFYFNPRTSAAGAQKYHYAKPLEPFLWYWDGTEEMLRNDDRLGCREESVSNERAYCTQLIRMNNWKIPDDYPLKF